MVFLLEGVDGASSGVAGGRLQAPCQMFDGQGIVRSISVGRGRHSRHPSKLLSTLVRRVNLEKDAGMSWREGRLDGH